MRETTPEVKPGGRANFLWLWWVLLSALPPIAFALSPPAYGDSYFFNMSWTAAVNHELEAGVFPPRHLTQLWDGLSGLDMFFYGPLPYWLGGVLDLLFCSDCEANTTIRIVAGLALSLSGASFFVLSRRFVTTGAAAFGSTVYMLMPYHLGIDWLWRQAAGEFYAYAFLPLVAAGIDIVLRERRLTAIFPLALAGLAVTHLPTLLLAAHVFLVVVMVWGVLRRPGWTEFTIAFLRLSILGLIGILLAAAVWLPAVILLGDVSPEALYSSRFEATSWLFPFEERPPELRTLIGVAIAAGVVMTLLAMSWRVPAGSRVRDWGPWTLAPVIACLFLMSAGSRFIWEHWVISAVQFPWRLMIFCDLSASLAAAAVAQAANAGVIRRGSLLGAIGLVVLGEGALLLRSPRLPEQYRYMQDYWQVMAGAPEYTPPAFSAAMTDHQGGETWKLRELEETILPRIRAAAHGYQAFDMTSRHVTAEPEPGASDMLLPLPYWEHWRGATMDGEPLVLAPGMYGLMSVSAPGGNPISGEVTLDLPFHWSEKAGAAMSAVAVILLAAMAGFTSVTRRRNATVHVEGELPRSTAPHA